MDAPLLGGSGGEPIILSKGILWKVTLIFIPTVYSYLDSISK